MGGTKVISVCFINAAKCVLNILIILFSSNEFKNMILYNQTVCGLCLGSYSCLSSTRTERHMSVLIRGLINRK